MYMYYGSINLAINTTSDEVALLPYFNSLVIYDFCLVLCLLCYSTVACPDYLENSVDADHTCLLFQYLLPVYFAWPPRSATSQSIRSTSAGKHTVSVLSCNLLYT